MKRFLKSLVPLILAVGILASVCWYLLVYDREFTRDMLITHARFFDSRGNTEFAARMYDLAYDYTGQDGEVAIELANQYKDDGNYTKAEYTLTNAIADGGNVELYIALCKTYVEQDKLLDAVAMLDTITDPALKQEIDRLRPAAPETNPAPGFYNQYINVEFKTGEGKLLCTTDGDYPSTQDAPFSGTFTLPAGETEIHAISVGENGLVSPLTVVNFTVGGVIEEAVFSDGSMELALRELLAIDPEDPVMTDQLWEIKEFTIPTDTQDLSDIRYLTNLEKLTVPERKLDSLGWLSSLNYLKELDLSGCSFPASELGILGGFQNLEKLSLAGCGLSTIADLSGTVKLTYLDLSGNTLRNLESLTQMTDLQELYLQNNAVTALDQLASLEELTKLDISYNSVTDLSPLAACPKLAWLNAGNNQIARLDGIEAFPSLTHLMLDHNQLTGVSILRKLTGLTVLNLSNNTISEIDALASLVNLTEMYCAYNQLVHLPVWPQETPLTILDISHNQIGSLSPLSEMDELTYVYCDYNWLTSLDHLANCYRLVMVNAYGNEIKDVSKLTDHNIIVNYDPTN